ncbi:106_t:CDS:2, partial [Racocetra fulgida]
NLANNVLFGAKEPFMIVLNEFLNDNIVKVTAFLEEISKLPNIPSFSDTRTGDQGNIRKLDETDRKALHKYLIENQEKMAKDLQTRRVKSINPASSANIILDQAQTSKKAWDKISTLLAHLGPPAESQKKDLFQSNNNRHFETNHQLFTEFMHRNANRSVDSIISKSLFYDGALSKVIEPYISKPYELLVDVTQFGQANEVQSQWVQQFMQILPFNAIENLAALYFYNPNKNAFFADTGKRAARYPNILESIVLLFARSPKTPFEA